MSQAIAHFAVGVSGTILILFITGWYTHNLAPLATFAGGFGGVLPDIHNVISHEGTTTAIQLVHNHPVADIFFFHYTMDVYDTSNSPLVSAASIIIMIVLIGLLTYARQRQLT